MNMIEKFADFMCCNSVEEWRNLLFKYGECFGYEQVLLAIFPDRHTPIEAAYAFLLSNYSCRWRNKYDSDNLGYVDPVVAHCATKSIPLIWSPEIFADQPQKDMYEEACGYGIRSGITFPIHGPKGELGVLCFVTDTNPGKLFQQGACRNLPELSLLRDFVFETSQRFIKSSCLHEEPAPITQRELECLKWSAAGKTSWETAQILNCAEATVNFHINNVRRKFDVNSRRQAIVKAIRLGMINPT